MDTSLKCIIYIARKSFYANVEFALKHSSLLIICNIVSLIHAKWGRAQLTIDGIVVICICIERRFDLSMTILIGCHNFFWSFFFSSLPLTQYYYKYDFDSTMSNYAHWSLSRDSTLPFSLNDILKMTLDFECLIHDRHQTD